MWILYELFSMITSIIAIALFVGAIFGLIFLVGIYDVYKEKKDKNK